MDRRQVFIKALTDEAKAIERGASMVTEEQVALLEDVFLDLQAHGGQLHFCGVGKSGHIAQKAASTFASLGLPSHVLHPIEALHGDLGRVRSIDSVVFISKSGTTEEIVKLIPFLKLERKRMIGLLGKSDGTIGQACGLVFDCSVEKEACLNNLAPTTSSTLALAMADAMAVVFEKITGHTKERFAVNHPAGLLGKSLSLQVENIMIPKEECARVNASTPIKEVLVAMTTYATGACAVVNQDGELEGLLVEGDVRRIFADGGDALVEPISNHMTKNPISVQTGTLAIDALEVMEAREKAITQLPVMDGKVFVGILRIHDLFKMGFQRKQ